MVQTCTRSPVINEINVVLIFRVMLILCNRRILPQIYKVAYIRVLKLIRELKLKYFTYIMKRITCLEPGHFGLGPHASSWPLHRLQVDFMMHALVDAHQIKFKHILLMGFS